MEDVDIRERVIHTWFSDVELYPDHLVQVAVEMVEVTGVQTSVIHRHVCRRMQEHKKKANTLYVIMPLGNTWQWALFHRICLSVKITGTWSQLRYVTLDTDNTRCNVCNEKCNAGRGNTSNLRKHLVKHLIQKKQKSVLCLIAWKPSPLKQPQLTLARLHSAQRFNSPWTVKLKVRHWQIHLHVIN